MKKTLADLLVAFTLRDLWLVGLFLFLFYLSPGILLHSLTNLSSVRAAFSD